MRRSKTVFSVLCICLILFQCIPFLAFAEDETVKISSAENFREFAKNCLTDSWSHNKTVILTQDIDLSEDNYTPVPTFGGVFDGQGFTISGINLSESGSVRGLFRYIAGGATVKNLNVKGNLFPMGTKSYIGGLAGENNGNIINCTFDGNVKGTASVGGIAGINQGMISNCAVYGEIYGEHYAGGISGKNLGSIILCKNFAKVNTYTEVVKLNIDNINTDKLLSLENTLDITDIGGIAGFSSGIIQSSENSGSIGYEHVGYNIGGICGRHTGYINGCTNSGTVNGRKDVGGICGQSEPYTILQYSKTSLERLGGELDSLDGIIDRAINNSKNSKVLISESLSAAKKYIRDAKDSVSKIADRASEKANEGIDSLNDTISDIDNFTSDMAAMVDGIMGESDSISDSFDAIRGIIDSYREDIEKIKGIWDEADFSTLEKALDQLSSAMSELQQASKYISKAFRAISNAMGDTYRLEEGLTELNKGMLELTKALDKIIDALNAIEKANRNFSDNAAGGDSRIKNIAELLKEVADEIKVISNSISSAKSSVSKISEGLVDLFRFISQIDPNNLIKSFDYIESSVNRLAAAASDMAAASRNLSRTRSSLQSVIDDTKEITDTAGDKADALGDEMDSISQSLKRSKELIRNFIDNSKINIKKIDNIDLEERDNLSAAISGIADSTDILGDNMSDFGDTFLNDLDDVRTQISVIFDVMTDSADELKNKSTNPRDYIEDISEYDDSQKQGKISACRNAGDVFGDLNVGGIAGCMAVEYDFDPEDDVVSKGEKSINFLYTTKAVISECVNLGKINARKNCVGGICGKQDLGMITGCLGKGAAASESGNYAGGIAGQSDSLIKNCYGKASISGDNYIGGIAGESDRIYDSVSVTNISEYEEYCGSISGKSNGICKNNFFVGDIGGIDNISYTGKAEQISIDTLLSMDNIPEDMKRFSLVFIADSEIIGEVFFDYGGSISENQIPDIPEKDGCYGVWDRESFENLTYDDIVTAVYDSYITSIESEEYRENGLAAIVAEGQFSVKSKLDAKRESKDGGAENWSIKINDSYGDSIKIHYLPKDGEKNLKITVLDQNGGKRKIKYVSDGKYIVFEAASDISGFSVSRSYAKVITVVLTVLTAIILILFTFIGMRKLKLKKELTEAAA